MSSNERFLSKTFIEELSALRVSDGSLIAGIQHDKFILVNPSTTTERYDYYFNTVLVAQVLLTYTTSSKNVLISAERL